MTRLDVLRALAAGQLTVNQADAALELLEPGPAPRQRRVPVLGPVHITPSPLLHPYRAPLREDDDPHTFQPPGEPR